METWTITVPFEVEVEGDGCKQFDELEALKGEIRKAVQKVVTKYKMEEPNIIDDIALSL
jgi:hypothetical protein